MLQTKPIGLALHARSPSSARLAVATPTGKHGANLVHPLVIKTSHCGLDQPSFKQQPYRGDAQRMHALGPEQEDLLKARSFRRTVADAQFWERYLTQERYFKNMLSFFSSRIIRGLYKPLSSVAIVATALCIYETARLSGALPSDLPSLALSTAEPITITSFAVSLLLVFRTNQSYDRWWEARKIWGLVLNRARDFTTQATVLIPEDEAEIKRAIARWNVAFVHALTGHLQGGVDLRAKLENTLDQEELEMLLKAPHRVVKVLTVLGQLSQQANIDIIARQMMQLNVQVYYDCMGACERIIRTPLPLTYTRHASRFLYIWILTLPFALYGHFGYMCVPISLLISTLLLGIDEIGVQIEEPFGVLPLSAIADRAEADARNIMKDRQTVSDYAKDLKYRRVLESWKDSWTDQP
jgi:putative membrane protein